MFVFSGLAVTSDILLALGLIGAIFDIVNGAIQKSKLQDAINSVIGLQHLVKYYLSDTPQHIAL